MSREFPDFIDPWRAAEGGRRIGGTIPLARLKRLQPLLAASDGEARFELQFGFDEQRRATVTAEVSAPLTLTCQRSLELYVEDVRQHSVLTVIGNQAEQALLSDEEEFLVVDQGRVAVADLVEDELLLGIPQVPRNPKVGPVWESSDGHGAERSSERESGETDNGRQRPFESLAELMKNR